MTQEKECTECVRLWQVYSSTTVSGINLDGRLRAAEIQHDADGVANLALEAETADASRVSAREAVRQHEVLVHGAGVPEGQVTGNADTPLPCLQQQQLMLEARLHLTRIATLSKEISTAIARREDALAAQLDTQIENELGLKERAMGALQQHKTEHGC